MKNIFSVTLTFVLAGVLATGTLAGQPDTLSILHITDLHTMFNLETYHPGIVHHREKVKNYENANNHLRLFLQTVPGQTQSDMVIASGDMIDFFQAETESGNMIGFQVEQFASFMENFPFPVLLTVGNHEFFSYEWKDDKLIPTQYFTGEARAAWIRNFNCFRNGTYYSRNFEVRKTNYRLIFLDTGFYKFSPEENIITPYLDKPQLHWLKNELNEKVDDIEIIIMHIPFTKGSVQPGSSSELFDLLFQHPSVRLILSGHKHRNLVQRYTRDAGQELIQVETDALVETPENWRLIRLTENSILVSATGTTENELTIPMKSQIE